MLAKGALNPQRLPANSRTLVSISIANAHRRQVPTVACCSARDVQSTSTSATCSPEFDEKKYRRNVGICVVNRQGLVFAAQRSDSGCNSWQMPQGGVDEGEVPEEACVRELEEETCIRPASVRILGQVEGWLTYDFPTQVRARLHGGWEKYQGQAQKWFLVLFEGDDSEINLDTEHKEFKEWRWMPLQDLPGSVVEFKQDVYTQVAAKFIPIIEDLKNRGALSS